MALARVLEQSVDHHVSDQKDTILAHAFAGEVENAAADQCEPASVRWQTHCQTPMRQCSRKTLKWKHLL